MEYYKSLKPLEINELAYIKPISVIRTWSREPEEACSNTQDQCLLGFMWGIYALEWYISIVGGAVYRVVDVMWQHHVNIYFIHIYQIVSLVLLKSFDKGITIPFLLFLQWWSLYCLALRNLASSTNRTFVGEEQMINNTFVRFPVYFNKNTHW